MGLFSKIGGAIGGAVKGIGGVLGGAIGLGKKVFGSEKYKMADVKFEGQQNQLANMLMQQAQGKGPSIAMEAMRKGTAQGLANIRGGLQGMSGLSQGAKARMYAQQAGQMTRGIASEGGTMRAQEMTQARKNLADFILGSQQQQTARSDVAYKSHEGAQQRRQSAVKGIGEGIATFATLGGMCWVARAIFGAGDIRWIYARNYVFNHGPVWFRNWYAKNGEEFAKKVKKSKILKALITPLFVYFANKGEELWDENLDPYNDLVFNQIKELGA
jgi:hypothetical protein